MSTSFKLGSLALALMPLATTAAPTPAPVHHLLAIDISGSMYSALTSLRAHLKNKLTSLIAPGDTLSLYWFSSAGQAGALFTAMEVTSVTDLSKIHTAIDRYLQPMGATGFKDPLTLMESQIKEFRKTTPGHLINLFFMTDGYENQSPEATILKICENLEPLVDSAAVVEYGWHCNHELLTKMAEKLNGTLLFSKDFEEYTSAFEGSLIGSTKKVRIELDRKAVDGQAFALAGDRLITFEVNDGAIMAPEGLSAVAFFTDGTDATPFAMKKHTAPELFACLVPLVMAGRSNDVFTVLSALGDVALIESFTNCFSKEDYVNFTRDVLAAATDPKLRYVKGYDPTAVPKEDAFTVIDLLDTLASDEENKVYVNDPAFGYERIGTATEAKNKDVSFKANKDEGYPISGLVWNELRPNVSFRVKMDGVVTLPESRPAGLPSELPSFIYRTYTIIKDGVVHTRMLPMSLAHSTFDALQAQGLLAGEKWEAEKIYHLSFPRLPVINRKMVKEVSAKETFQMALDLLKLKGEQKVISEWQKIVSPKTSKDLLASYGEDATAWLAEQGITSYNGYSPLTSKVESTDVAYATELKIAAKGLSSLPTVVSVESAMEAKATLKPAQLLMASACRRIDEVLQLSGASAEGNEQLKHWLEVEAALVIANTRKKMAELAKLKFAIVVGKSWFSEAPTREDTFQMDVTDQLLGKVSMTASLLKIEYKI